jgi:hypothetical protein
VKMLRNIKTGEIFPVNKDMMRHDDIQLIEVPDKRKIKKVRGIATIDDRASREERARREAAAQRRAEKEQEQEQRELARMAGEEVDDDEDDIDVDAGMAGDDDQLEGFDDLDEDDA